MIRHILSLTALLCAGSLTAQVTIDTVALDSLAAAMRADTSFVEDTLFQIKPEGDPFVASFDFDGITFDKVDNLALGAYVLSPRLFATVSAISKSSIDMNTFGIEVSDEQTALFANYSASEPNSKKITVLDQTAIDFYHFDATTGDFGLHDNTVHFATYIGYDNVTDEQLVLFFIDDRDDEFVDYNDGVFLVRTGIIPEAATGSLIVLGSAVLGLLMMRRRA